MTVKKERFLRLLPHFPITILLLVAALIPAHAQSFNLLYTFQYPGPTDPLSGVTVDAAGNLYGTTSETYGGAGSVYKLSFKNGAWVFSVVYTFPGYSNGNTPLAPPTFGPDGSLYGTTYEGGFGCDLGCGNVYNLHAPAMICKTARCDWMFSTVYNFGTDPNDGAYPMFGSLAFDSAGNMFGTNNYNGIQSDACCGTVFEMSRSNGVWGQTILHQFGSGNDGLSPTSGLIRDTSGNWYGTTSSGGNNHSCNSQQGCGTVYELSPSGSSWNEQVLYSFQGQSDGDTPIGGLVMDASGNLYGTTSAGGVDGGGTVFEISQSNGNWNLTTLYSFAQTGQFEPFCSAQEGNLLLDSAGNLYGTTCSNGALGYGAVFKLTHSNGGWIYSSLHDFTNGSDGANPVGNPAFDHHGNIVGTASRGGGQTLAGTVWEVTP